MREDYRLLCKWVLNIVLILAFSSTFQKEIHFIQTFRERKFPQISLGLLQVKRFLAASKRHQQPPSFERVNLGRVSHRSAVLAYRAGSVLLKSSFLWRKFECGKEIDAWIDQRTWRITKIHRGQSEENKVGKRVNVSDLCSKF